jgi:hypothetical protein
MIFPMRKKKEKLLRSKVISEREKRSIERMGKDSKL